VTIAEMDPEDMTLLEELRKSQQHPTLVLDVIPKLLHNIVAGEGAKVLDLELKKVETLRKGKLTKLYKCIGSIALFLAVLAIVSDTHLGRFTVPELYVGYIFMGYLVPLVYRILWTLPLGCMRFGCRMAGRAFCPCRGAYQRQVDEDQEPSHSPSQDGSRKSMRALVSALSRSKSLKRTGRPGSSVSAPSPTPGGEPPPPSVKDLNNRASVLDMRQLPPKVRQRTWRDMADTFQVTGHFRALSTVEKACQRAFVTGASLEDVRNWR
jgi:hypothetical protein